MLQPHRQMRRSLGNPFRQSQGLLPPLQGYRRLFQEFHLDTDFQPLLSHHQGAGATHPRFQMKIFAHEALCDDLIQAAE